MKLDEATRGYFQAYVDGKLDYPAPNQITRRFVQAYLWAEEHKDELDALECAQTGDTEPLAALIEETGALRTLDARAFVAGNLRGRQGKKGRPRKIEIAVRRALLVLRVLEIMNENGCNQSIAIQRYLDETDGVDFESARSDFNRGKELLLEVFTTLGLGVGPALQKG